MQRDCKESSSAYVTRSRGEAKRRKRRKKGEKKKRRRSEENDKRYNYRRGKSSDKLRSEAVSAAGPK